MRFMMFMHPAISDDEWRNPKAEDFATMDRYNQELQAAGALLDLAGLHPAGEATAVRWNTGRPVVEDGPFGEAKEVVGGYWLIQVSSKEEAVQWATRVPNLGDAWVELRQIQDLEDFPPEVVGQIRTEPSAGA